MALLAWSELFESFGNGTSLVPLETILVEVGVAWFANAGAGMARSYVDHARAEGEPRVNHARTGVSVFADDFQTIRVLAERDNDAITQWTRHERGGHFAVLEVPELVVADLVTFFAG